ncbi:MAG TPA: GNAT family N-acetyltransferase [Roseiarcus sp.]|nr:GNAT family N-acetyltransferase [Roseiarcus sp.]
MLAIRTPNVGELPALGDLCMRSKAVWGYDEKFMAACRTELSFDAFDLLVTRIAVVEQDNKLLGVAQITLVDTEAHLMKLFVDPTALRHGAGKVLFAWAVAAAKDMGARRLLIDSDPAAASFYRRMGARDAGLAPSGSIAGRMLPKLLFALGSAT